MENIETAMEEIIEQVENLRKLIFENAYYEPTEAVKALKLRFVEQVKFALRLPNDLDDLEDSEDSDD